MSHTTTLRPRSPGKRATALDRQDRIMRTFIALCLIGLVVALVGCGEGSVLTDVDQASFAKGGIRGGSATVSDATTSEQAGETTTTEVGSFTLRHRADAPPLRTYETSFTAIAGRRTIFDLHYADGTWFMEVVIPQGATLLDANGQPVPKGTPVEITLQLDPELFQVTFGPHGSTFLGVQPAKLLFSLEYAELAGTDPSSLRVIYQPHEGDLWTSLGTTWNEKSYWIEAEIYHFSNYAVAW